jgi:hypothetical protein
MANAIESKPPTLCDEEVGEETLSDRYDGYMRVFGGILEFMTPVAALFVQRLSPSANYPFTVFNIDEALNEMVDELDDALSENGEQITHNVLEAEGDPNRVLTAIRMAGPINLSAWRTALEYLGWNIDGLTINEEADIGAPSFEVIDDEIGPVPVYLSSLIRVPEDYSDPTVNLFMKACLGDFIQNVAYETDAVAFLVLWRWPLHREVSGKHYCCIGAKYSLAEGEWQDVLVSKYCVSPSSLFELHDLAGPINEVGISWSSEALVDEDKRLSGIFAVLLSGCSPLDQPAEGWKLIHEFIEDTGWACLSVAEVRKPTRH